MTDKITDEEIVKLCRELILCVPSDGTRQELDAAEKEMKIILSNFFINHDR